MKGQASGPLPGILTSDWIGRWLASTEALVVVTTIEDKLSGELLHATEMRRWARRWVAELPLPLRGPRGLRRVRPCWEGGSVSSTAWHPSATQQLPLLLTRTITYIDDVNCTNTLPGTASRASFIIATNTMNLLMSSEKGKYRPFTPLARLAG